VILGVATFKLFYPFVPTSTR